MILELIIFLSISLLAWRRWQLRKIMQMASKIKCDIPTLPILGHSYLFIGNDEHQMQTFQRFGREAIKQGGVTTLWHAHKLNILISDPVTAEFVLKNCLEKGYLAKLGQFALGNGSIFAPVSIWRPRRKILAPSFSPKNLMNFMTIFITQSQMFVDQLRSRVSCGDFSIWDHATTLTMDTVFETALGVKLESQRNPNQPILIAAANLFKLAAARVCQPWLHSDFVYNKTVYHQIGLKSRAIVFNFINQIISKKRIAIREERKTQLKSDITGYKKIIELLIEYSGGETGYTDVELREETVVVVGAGTDTSAVGISFVILMLSRYSEVQEKVYQEILQVFGSSNRPMHAKDILRLHYLDAVIKETLRLYPPVPIIFRTVLRDIVLPTGLTLVNGTDIMVNIWAIHRNPKYWGDDAELFRPERFSDTPLKHPAAFMAFSNGPRGCLGYQYAMNSMKTAITALLREYRVLPAAASLEGSAADTPLRVKFNIMMRHVGDYMVQLDSRN